MSSRVAHFGRLLSHAKGREGREEFKGASASVAFVASLRVSKFCAFGALFATEARGHSWAGKIGSRRMRLSAVFASLALAACASTPSQEATSSAARIDPVRMSNMIRTLASDEYEG